jgi:hypothetical protein
VCYRLGPEPAAAVDYSVAARAAVRQRTYREIIVSQALAKNPFERTLQFSLLGHGVVHGRLDQSNGLRLSTQPGSGLDWAGLLYPFTGIMTLTEGQWRLRADTLTFKASPKAKAKILPLLTQVVNDVMAGEGDVTEAMQAYQLQQEREKILKDIHRAEGEISYAEMRLAELSRRA